MIEVKHLTFSYGKEPFIEDMNFDVKEGEIFGFLGPSGAGKSTLEKIIIGLIPGYQGSVTVGGIESNHHGKDFYENIGVDFEFSTMYEKMTARENLRFFASLKESIEDLISFAVGSILGLHRVANEWNSENIPEYLLLSEVEMLIDIAEYDKDKNDVVVIFFSFIKKVFGFKFFEENIEFIAKALNQEWSAKAVTPENIIRQYFFRDYYKYHLKVFTDPTGGSKKFSPLWQFSSGKEGAINALIWYQKYNPQILSKIIAITEKIYKPWYQQNFEDSTARDKRKRYLKKLNEINNYINRLKASTDVTIDLEDRMEANYKKFDKGIFFSIGFKN